MQVGNGGEAGWSGDQGARAHASQRPPHPSHHTRVPHAHTTQPMRWFLRCPCACVNARTRVWPAGASARAEGNRRRFTYRAYVFLQFFFPLAILFFGLTVAAFAMAYFAPLISLIQKLCG